MSEELKELENLEYQIRRVRDEMERLATSTSNMGSELGVLSGPLSEAAQSYGLLAAPISLVENALDHLKIKNETAVESIQQMLEGFLNATEGTRGFANAAGNVGEAAANAGESLFNAGEKGLGLGQTLLEMVSPSALATTAIGLLGAGIGAYVKNIEEARAKTGELIASGFNGFQEGVQTAQGYLTSFDDSLFVSAEKQTEIVQGIQEVQANIRDLIQEAMAANGEYTTEQSNNLDEYFAKLEELNSQQVAAEQMKSEAIAQQAVMMAETHDMSLEEYQVNAEQWIATAQEQADKQKALIEEQTTQELVLLNQRYGEEATMENTKYAEEYTALMDKKKKSIEAANAEVGEVTAAFASGYAEQAGLQDIFTKQVGANHQSMEDENKRYTETIEALNEQQWTSEEEKNLAIGRETSEHQNRMSSIWKSLTKDMSQNEVEQLGVFMGMAANSEMYGGKLDENAQKTAEAIVSSYDSMPKETREAMEKAMKPMVEEMEKSEPSLFSKAINIGKGILSRLRKAFDEHSPSRETRKIFRFVMEGGLLGMEDEEKGLYQQSDDIAKGVIGRLEKGLQNARLTLPDLPGQDIVQQVNGVFEETVQLAGQNSDELAEKLARALRESPIQVRSTVDAMIETTNMVELDGERVGRSIAPTISRVLARNLS